MLNVILPMVSLVTRISWLVFSGESGNKILRKLFSVVTLHGISAYFCPLCDYVLMYDRWVILSYGGK